MPEAIDILRREHRNLAKLLSILERQINRLVDGARPDYELLQAIVDYFQAYPAQCHHPKEDIIFRKLAERDPRAAADIGDLEEEHKVCAERLTDFAHILANVINEAEIPRDVVAGAAREFIINERRHMVMEERKFMPAALDILTKDDWAEIDRQVTDETDPLFGGSVTEQFRGIREEIEAWEAEDQAAGL